MGPALVVGLHRAASSWSLTSIAEAQALFSAEGTYLTTGAFTGTADFDPSGGTSNLTANGDDDDLFISKLDANGVLA